MAARQPHGPCQFCGIDIDFHGTKMCDICWELHRRLKDVEPYILKKIIKSLGL